MIGAKPNTVQLDAEDGGDGLAGGLGPGGVAGAFDLPLGHLALDESGVGSEPPHRVQTPAQLDDGVRPGPFRVLRGKNRAPVTASVG